MAIRFKCNCGKTFTVKDELAGKRAKCTNCAAVLTIPPPSPQKHAVEITGAPDTAEAQEPAPGEQAKLPGKPLLERIKEALKSPRVRAEIIIVVALLLVIGAGYFAYKKLTKPKKPAAAKKEPAPESQQAPAKPGTAPSPGPAKPREPGPTPREKKPKPQTLSFFAAPELVCRDHLRRIGKALEQYKEKQADYPPDLAALVPDFISKEEAAKLQCPASGGTPKPGLDQRYKYVGPEVARLTRPRFLVYDAQPHKNGSRGALFSDGAVLFLAAAEQKAVTLRKVRKEWLTPAETRLLAKLTPKLRVVNHRFSSLEVKVGGSTLGAVAKGRTRTFAVAARNLPLVLVAKTISTKPVKMRFRNAVIEIVRIPRHRDLPVIPIHEYLRAFRQEDPGQDRGAQRFQVAQDSGLVGLRLCQSRHIDSAHHG